MTMTTHPLTITAQPDVPFIDIERILDAPRELVLRCYTDPELVQQWLGPEKYEMVVEEYDVRDGGRYRYIHRGEDGSEYAFHGVFHGEPTLDGMVQTFEFEAWPGHVALDAVQFVEDGTRTIVRIHSTYQSVADRDGMVESGMAEGVSDGFRRLDELLTRLR